jgi:hypothetical protein
MATLTLNLVRDNNSGATHKWTDNPDMAKWDACLDQAAADLVAAVRPVQNVTISITVCYNCINNGISGGTNYGTVGLGASTYFALNAFTYSQVRTQLLLIPTNAVTAVAYNSTNLPSSFPLAGITDNFQAPWAWCSFIGLTADQGSNIKSCMGFAGGAYDYTLRGMDSSINGTGYPLYGVMMHELTEIVLGRAQGGDTPGNTGGWKMNDLYSWQSAGVRNQFNNATRNLSYDQGSSASTLYGFNNNNTGGADLTDLDGATASTFNAFGTPDRAVSRDSNTPLFANDWLWLSLIGGELTPQGLIWAGLQAPATVTDTRTRFGQTNQHRIHSPGAWQRV